MRATASTSPSTRSTAREVFLLLFDTPDGEPTDIIRLQDRDKYIWHARVEGLKAGQLYGYKVRGEYRPEWGLRFNDSKLLLDPYAKAVTGKFRNVDNLLLPYDPRPGAGEPTPGYARQHRHRAERDRDRRRVRLAGRSSTRPRPGAARHLRGARKGIHGAPVLRRRLPGHLPRIHREDPAPYPARRQRRRAPARPRILRGRLPGSERPDELLGLQLHRILRARVVLRQPAGARLPGRRVQDAGAGAPQGGHQGHPRRRLQPHRRGERDWAP